MSHFLDNPDLYDQPIRLTKEQKETPYQVLEDFFGDYQLYELRHYLWEMVEACLITEESVFEDADKRASLLILYEKMEEFLEASSIITKLRENDNEE